MLISPSKNFVFVHIFKTAGTSVSALFLPHARFIEKVTYKYYITRKLVAIYARIFHLENEGQKFITGYHKHATAKEIIERMGSENFQQKFSFCFVRNPYDHMVSLYHYIKQSRGHYLHLEANNLGFNEFIRHYLTTGPQRQTDFVYLGNKQIVTFVGKFEQLENDLKKICKKIGVSYTSVSHANSSSRGRNFQEYFTSEDVLNLFNTYFRDDFEHFGYKKMVLNNPS